MKLSGRAWKFADNLGATDLVSPQYDKQGMNRQWDECARHLLEDSNPEFAGSVTKGDILVSGHNFGAGHAHYYMTAIMACKAAGVAGMFAESVNGLFQRAAIDHGLPTWQLAGLSDIVSNGDLLDLDLAHGAARNSTTGQSMSFKPLSPVLLDILAAGGSDNWALRRVGAVPPVA